MQRVDATTAAPHPTPDVLRDAAYGATLISLARRWGGRLLKTAVVGFCGVTLLERAGVEIDTGRALSSVTFAGATGAPAAAIDPAPTPAETPAAAVGPPISEASPVTRESVLVAAEEASPFVASAAALALLVLLAARGWRDGWPVRKSLPVTAGGPLALGGAVDLSLPGYTADQLLPGAVTVAAGLIAMAGYFLPTWTSAGWGRLKEGRKARRERLARRRAERERERRLTMERQRAEPDVNMTSVLSVLTRIDQSVGKLEGSVDRVTREQEAQAEQLKAIKGPPLRGGLETHGPRNKR